MLHSSQLRNRRRGFTLIELLAVIAIIGILVAMLGAAIFRLSGSQVQKRTEADMVKIATFLDQHWHAVIDKANKEPVPSQIQALADFDSRRAKALWIMFNLKREFPTSPAEVSRDLSVVGFPTARHPTYAQECLAPPNGAPYQSTKTVPAEKVAEESSACLYLALSQGRSGITGSIDEIGSTAIKSVTFSAGGNNTKAFKIFVDGWGRPINFMRWGYEVSINNETSTTPYVQSSRNRYDPDNTFSGNPVWNTNNKSQAMNLLRFMPPGFGAPDPNYPLGTFNYATYLQSAAKDGVYTFGGGVSNDDIFSFRLRQTGQRGN